MLRPRQTDRVAAYARRLLEEMEPLGTWKSTRTEGRRLPENVDDFTELELRAHVEHDTRVRRVISAAHRAPLRVYRLRG